MTRKWKCCNWISTVEFFCLRLFYVFFDNNNIIALKMRCLLVGSSSVLVTEWGKSSSKLRCGSVMQKRPFFVVVARSSLSHSAISTFCFLSLKSTGWLQTKLTAQDRVWHALSDTHCPKCCQACSFTLHELHTNFHSETVLTSAWWSVGAWQSHLTANCFSSFN